MKLFAMWPISKETLIWADKLAKHTANYDMIMIIIV